MEEIFGDDPAVQLDHVAEVNDKGPRGRKSWSLRRYKEKKIGEENYWTLKRNPSRTRYLLDSLKTKSYLLETYVIDNYLTTYCHLLKISFLNI